MPAAPRFPAPRFAAAALIGTSGSLVMLAMLWPHWRSDWPFLFAAASGASSMGFLFADCLGHPGRKGIALCLAGALLTTFFGAAVAGLGLGLVLAATPAGLFIAPVAVGQALLTQPHVLITWTFSMVLAQLAQSWLRSRPLIHS